AGCLRRVVGPVHPRNTPSLEDGDQEATAGQWELLVGTAGDVREEELASGHAGCVGSELVAEDSVPVCPCPSLFVLRGPAVHESLLLLVLEVGHLGGVAVQGLQETGNCGQSSAGNCPGDVGHGRNIASREAVALGSECGLLLR